MRMTNESPVEARVFPRNLVRHLRALATERPRDTALVTVSRDGETRVDYQSLDQRVRALAAVLQAHFVPGERALLLLDNDQHYVAAFLACLHAGVIAVPVFPPESMREQHLARLAAIASDCEARCVLTSVAIRGMVGAHARIFGKATLLEVDVVDTALAARWREHDPSDVEIAFLQYTSGSTSTPKGVMVTHGNLMANERAIEERLSVRADDVFVNWLPLYHDMGLIGGLLQPLHRGIPVVLMSPGFFLERPVRWLEAISRYRGTISGGPDFAYRLCIERVKAGRLSGLDLSSWRVAFSGAEPVRHDTLRTFVDQFEPAGFGAEALYPCYGLAEATLLVSGSERGAGMVARTFSAASLAQGWPQASVTGTTLVACGIAPREHQIEIVDVHTLAALPHGQIGEIQAGGPSIAQGYWNRPAESDASFIEREGRRWLRTGDLGFVHGDQLFITGRIKDLIIVRGQNLYPQDIERCIETEVDAVRRGRVAAFAVDTPQGEGIGVAAEVSRSTRRLVQPEALTQALSQAVGLLCGEPLSVVVLLNPGGLPKTSSGKLQRGACRQGWASRSLDAYAIWESGRWVLGGTVSEATTSAPFDELEALIAAIWSDVLRWGADHRATRDTHFFACGGNSLAATQVAAAISARWDIDFPVRRMFEHPRLGECAAEVRRDLAIGARRKEKNIPALTPQQRAAALPLSHAQERQWFLWRLDPSSTAYHLSFALRLRGSLQVELMRRAFDTLIARHEALRTVFATTVDGTPVQRIGPAFNLDLPIIDLCGCSETDVEARAAEEAQRLQTQAMDLMHGPLLRAALLRLTDNMHVLVMVMHHIVSDGTSMQRLLDELAVCYAAHAERSSPALRELPMQHVDYALWQRAWLANGEGARQLAWWREQLGNEHPVMQLPVDRPRTSDASRKAARNTLTLSAALVSRLRDSARAHDATLFMVLLTGFQALLYRHTGQRDIRVGVPVANRAHEQAQAVVGLFVNTLVLRNVFDARTTLAQALQRARDATVGAQAHQELPFEHLVEQLRPARRSTHNPLFQVMFNHLVEDFSALEELPGLQVDACALGEPMPQFDLALDVIERRGGVQVVFNYAADLFEASTIERLAAHYQVMLSALAEQPSMTVGDVPLLSAPERDQLWRWGVNRRCLEQADPVHRLIERQAQIGPQAPALIHGTETLSRSDLDRMANRLAHRLIALGVKSDAQVGVALERSTEMVIAILAILKAGGAYVPLDPAYPLQRLADMVIDSRIGLLLTRGELRDRIPACGDMQVLDLGVIDLDDEADYAPNVAVHGEQLAYVIHTSGSTGRPKGVGVPHAALARHLEAATAYLRLTPEDRMLQFSTINFDGFVEQLFAPLVAGATVVLRGPALWDSETFYRELIDKRVSVADLPAAYWNVLAQDFAARGHANYGALRQVHASGEAMPSQGIRAWRDAGLSSVKLLNLYGPTETVVTATVHECLNDELERVPIGRPLIGRNAYVLDADLNLAPQGTVGELYIGGPLLARGYVNRAAPSAERFVADPFTNQGGRMYRTGDLVRWNVAGELEYLGRIDHQIKLRGLRIELGEIEAQMLAQSEVKEAVVIAADGPGGLRLVGYVSMRDPQPNAASSLQEKLRAALPEHMVPAAIVVLPSLPVTTSGKVDREALPEPVMASADPTEAPRGDVEEAVAGIWAELLHVPRVGRHENFFELGGHSLLLLQVHRHIAERLNRHPSVADLFQYPTVESLASFLATGARTEVASQQQRVEERVIRQRGSFLQRKTNAARVPS